MESTLHRQLKALYVQNADQREVRVDGYRVDGVQGRQLIEVQCASLSAIRHKVGRLLRRHRVKVIKPLAARKFLVTWNRPGGKVVSSRYSPARATRFDLFEELVHFVTVFPHPRLTLDVLFIELEERRVPRRRRRWRDKNYRVVDRLLRAVHHCRTLSTADDLRTFLPDDLPEVFTTADVARAAGIPRWLAQKMAYCLRKTGAVDCVETRGSLRLYRGVTNDNRTAENNMLENGTNDKNDRRTTAGTDAPGQKNAEKTTGTETATTPLLPADTNRRNAA